MIYIRADANEKIGTGHIMRCLSIASQIKKLNQEVMFVVADNNAIQLIEDKGYSTICLHSKWDNLNQEIDMFSMLIEKNDIQKVIIDSYYVTERYLSSIRKKVKTYYIDDLNKLKYPVDVLINYNIYGTELDYNTQYKNEKTSLLLGMKYVPLRQEFIGIRDRKFKQIQKVLITSGGTDNYNVVGNLLQKIINDQEFSEYEYYCILGCYNKNQEKLNLRFGKYKNIKFLRNVANMDYYMKECDIAITAGGTTTYELCACGIPSIVYTIADNQHGIAHSFSEKDIIPWVGDIRENIDICLENIFGEMRKLKDADCWTKRSRKMQSFVDGNGAARIALEIIK